MIHWYWLAIAFFAGVIMGVFLTALIVAGGDDRK